MNADVSIKTKIKIIWEEFNMNKQLSFKMPVVDEKETKSRRGSFEEYRCYLATMSLDLCQK